MNSADQDTAYEAATVIRDALIAESIQEKATHIWSQEGDKDPFGVPSVGLYASKEALAFYVVEADEKPPRTLRFQRSDIDLLEAWMQSYTDDPYVQAREVAKEEHEDAYSSVVANMQYRSARRSEAGRAILKVWQ